MRRLRRQPAWAPVAVAALDRRPDKRLAGLVSGVTGNPEGPRRQGLALDPLEEAAVGNRRGSCAVQARQGRDQAQQARQGKPVEGGAVAG